MVVISQVPSYQPVVDPDEKFNIVNYTYVQKMYIEYASTCSHCKSVSSTLFKSFQHLHKLGIAVFLPTQLEALDKHAQKVQ